MKVQVHLSSAVVMLLFTGLIMALNFRVYVTKEEGRLGEEARKRLVYVNLHDNEQTRLQADLALFEQAFGKGWPLIFYMSEGFTVNEVSINPGITDFSALFADFIFFFCAMGFVYYVFEKMLYKKIVCAKVSAKNGLFQKEV